MTYYTSKYYTDILLSYIRTYYQTYLDAIATTSGVTLKSLSGADLGGPNFASKNRPRPYLLIEPMGEDIDDTLPGRIESVLRYDALIEADGFQEEDALILVGLYKDAFCSMIFSDDTLSGYVDHASVTNIEQYPGGSGTSKYILMAVEITVSQGR